MPANPFQSGYIRSFVDIGPEVLVNGETNSNQQDARLTVLTNGNYIVTWQSNLQDGSGLGIYSKLYSSDGTALTGDLPMNVTTAGDQQGPEVVALDNGRAMVVWTTGGDIWYRIVEADGTSPAGEFQVNQTSTGNNFSIEKFASDDFMITWEASDGVGNSTGVFGQRFQFNGNKEFAEIQINDGVTGQQKGADTAELLSGTVFTVFQSQGQVGAVSEQGIYLRNYSNTSTLVGSDIKVADAVGEREVNPQIEALDGGGFVVSWVNSTTGDVWAQTFLNTGAAVPGSLTNVSDTVSANTLGTPVLKALPNDRYVVLWENDASLSKDIYYKVLESDGSTVSTGILHTVTSGGQSNAEVHVLPQGGFITVYTGGSGSALDVFIVRHAEDGTPVGPPMQAEYPVNSTTGSSQISSDVAVTDEGEIIVTWQSTNQDGSGTGVYMQRFASPEIGTEGNDTMTGDGAKNFLAGWKGDDTISGLDGADILEGGLGADKLNGGRGSDELIGGLGADNLSGGRGNDKLTGDKGSDKLNGGRGNDKLFGGDGDDMLLGGDAKDQLYGNKGNDQLFGDKGADKLYVSKGNDEYSGGSGADRFIFDKESNFVGRGDTNKILDFENGKDLIDLRGTDADSNIGGDQAFTFIGGAGFSGTAGELRATQNGSGDWQVRGDIDGDGQNDFTIKVIGFGGVLDATDFLL